MLRGAAGFLAAVLAFLLLVPVVRFKEPLSTVLLDADGQLLSASIAADGQWRFEPPETVPERFAEAVVRFEDRRFRWHPGVDPIAVVRAAIQNLRAGRVVSGGSTLTMQVVRLARGNRPRTVLEKAIEAVLALRLEAAASKDRILALWAGHAPFGGNVVGLEAASWRYFGRGPEHLSWAEAATLAVLPNSPALIHPGRNRDRLRRRRDALLERLHEDGLLDDATYRLALAEPLPPRPYPLPNLAPHLLERVRSGEAEHGARVVTTLSRELQARATEIVRRYAALSSGNGVYNAAAIVAEVDTGRVLAYVGNRGGPDDPAHGGWVDIVTAPRSTGSILKPFLYAEMLSAGEILPTQLVPDIPTRIAGYAPQNYDHTYAGAVPAAVALARSLNVPAVRMLRAHGVDRFHAELRAMGMTTLYRPASGYGLTLILGGAEATLWDVTAMYAGLARTVNRAAGGPVSPPPFAPLRFEAAAPSDGDTPGGALLPGAGACYETLRALLEVGRPGVDRAWRSFASARKIAWKTGTSWGHRDAWAVGVTPRHVVGVWVGNADGEGRPGLTGHAYAAPILFELFGLLGRDGWFERPPGELVRIRVCAASGFRPGPDCARTVEVEVPRSALPGRVCPWCRLVHLDRDGRFRVHGGCEPVSAIRNVPWFVLPPAMETYYRRRHPEYLPLPPVRPDCRGAGGPPPMSCLRPEPGSEVWIPVELDGSLGRLVFQAAHRRPDARIFWHLDGIYLGETEGIHRLAAAPEPGPHRLTLVDDQGATLTVPFTVVSRNPPDTR